MSLSRILIVSKFSFKKKNVKIFMKYKLQIENLTNSQEIKPLCFEAISVAIVSFTFKMINP